ncbi:hypothetical protein LZ32DRAFT_601127 [Colletotrichum eremochloae]|nr:hypothetical protein LZ32DRAFT_601127 [Colletotrichum eremochloae]
MKTTALVGHLVVLYGTGMGEEGMTSDMIALMREGIATVVHFSLGMITYPSLILLDAGTIIAYLRDLTRDRLDNVSWQAQVRLPTKLPRPPHRYTVMYSLLELRKS